MWTSKPLSEQNGMALPLTLFFLLMLVIGGTVFFVTSQTEIKHSSSYERRLEALSVAESAAERAIWKLSSDNWESINESEWNAIFSGDTALPPIKIGKDQYMRVSFPDPEKVFRGMDDVTDMNSGYAHMKFIATGIIGHEQNGKVIPICTKQIEIIVRVDIDLSSEVFDYAYFINNWGWWYYGGGEQCDGSMRSNGRFDLNGGGAITIDGEVEAHFDVDYHNKLPNGLAGLRGEIPPPDYTTYPYMKPDQDKETIPNLQDLTYYRKIATGETGHEIGKIKIGDRVFTDDGIFGDDESHENLVLIGTKEAPVEIHNTVVVEGNLVMKGYVKTYGEGGPKGMPFASIYVGRNMYVAGNIEYIDGPDWSSYPKWQSSSGTDYKDRYGNTLNIVNNDDCLAGETVAHPSDSSPRMDDWVKNNSTGTLLSIAAKGGLVYGNYSSSNWYSERWLFGMGNEDVGEDGIPDTNVYIDGHWTDPTEGDGIFQKDTEDLDGDGKFRNYDYGWKDVTTAGGNSQNSAPLQNFDGLRRDGGDSGPLWDPIGKITINHYYDTATNMISNVDGVYYTQHFLAGRAASSPRFRGSLISKDEAIVYSGKLQLVQDTRYHSWYRNDPNFPMQLFPPGSLLATGELGELEKVVSWREL